MSYSANRFIICTGFHRSGTSFLAQALANSHCDMGDDLLGASFSNPLGHVEDRECVELNDSLLTYNQQNWQFYGQQKLNIPPAFVQLLQAYVHSRMSNISGVTAGVKDPRISMLLPQWHIAVPGARWLFTYRHWSQCIHSLLRRSSRHLFHRSVSFSQHKVNARFFEEPELAAKMWLYTNRKIIEFVKLKASEKNTLLVSQHALTCNTINKEKIGEFCHSPPGMLTFSNFDEALLTRSVDPQMYAMLTDDVIAQCEDVWQELQSLSDFPSEETLPQEYSCSIKTLSSDIKTSITIPTLFYQDSSAEYLTAFLQSEPSDCNQHYAVVLRKLLLNGASPKLTRSLVGSSKLLLKKIADWRVSWLSDVQQPTFTLIKPRVTSVISIKYCPPNRNKTSGVGAMRNIDNLQPASPNFYIYGLVVHSLDFGEHAVQKLINIAGDSADLLLTEALYYRLLAINPSIENIIKFVSFLEATGMNILLKKYLSVFVEKYAHSGLRFRFVLLTLKEKGLSPAKQLYQEFKLADTNSPLQAVYQRRIRHFSAKPVSLYSLFASEQYEKLVDKCSLYEDPVLKRQIEIEYLRFVSVRFLIKHGASSLVHPYHQKTFQHIWKPGQDESLYNEILTKISGCDLSATTKLLCVEAPEVKLIIEPSISDFYFDITVTFQPENSEKKEENFIVIKSKSGVDRTNIALLSWYISCFIKSNGGGELVSLYREIVNDVNTKSFACNTIKGSL